MGDPNLAEYGASLDHRRQLKVREDLFRGNPGAWGVPLRDRESPDGDGQIDRIYPDLTERRLPVERFGEGFRKYGFEDGGESEETEEGIDQNRGPPRDQSLPHEGFRPDLLQPSWHGTPPPARGLLPRSYIYPGGWGMPTRTPPYRGSICRSGPHRSAWTGGKTPSSLPGRWPPAPSTPEAPDPAMPCRRRS